jgi:acetylornithine deacetylase/succinyl-diaminopimelate desuccinylase-like protein
MLGDLADDVEVSVRMNNAASVSETHTPLWDAIERVSAKLVPEATCIPSLTPGGNDAGVFRSRGATAYGFGLFSNAISIEQFFDMFHGDNERIDLESLRLSRELWTQLANDFLGA